MKRPLHARQYFSSVTTDSVWRALTIMFHIDISDSVRPHSFWFISFVSPSDNTQSRIERCLHPLFGQRFENISMADLHTWTVVFQSGLAQRNACRESSSVVSKVVRPDDQWHASILLSDSALFKRLFETVGTKQNAKEEQKTIYDMITNLSGHALPGIPQNSVPPKKMDEATKQYLWQHRLLLLFLK